MNILDLQCLSEWCVYMKVISVHITLRINKVQCESGHLPAETDTCSVKRKDNVPNTGSLGYYLQNKSHFVNQGGPNGFPATVRPLTETYHPPVYLSVYSQTSHIVSWNHSGCVLYDE